MKLRKVLTDLARAVADEAERSPEFAQRIEAVLGLNALGHGQGHSLINTTLDVGRRPKNRRPPAILDPVATAREGEQVLRSKLAPLTLDQLKDIVADYGMDPGKLVMKWKGADRIIDRIVEISMGRAQKGDAFRSE